MKLKTIELPFRIKKSILALGSQTKNTICFLNNNVAYLSQIHSNLTIPDNFLSFEKTIKYFLKKHPKIIAYDLHPEYESTKYIKALSMLSYKLTAIQHHHAHLASCMIENGLNNQKVIGIAFDGTGLGDDHTLWGAEFLICDYSGYVRYAHLRYIPLVGADRAIWQSWRIAILWLYLIYKDRIFDLGIDFVKRIDRKKWLVLKRMYNSGFNSPLTSSMGRLFDSVASLVLNKLNVKFEAEAAIELEKKATKYISTALPRVAAYHFQINPEGKKYVIDPASIIKEIVLDLKHKRSKELIAYKFHYTVAEIIRKMCLTLRKKTKINKIVLSGGVFQNKILLKLSLDLLYKEGFSVFTHKKLSCSDSSISLGQAAIGNYKRGN